MIKSEIYREGKNSGVSSVIETYDNCEIEMDVLIEKMKSRKPIFIFENLISADKSINYSMIGLETKDIDYRTLGEFYDKKKKIRSGETCNKSNSPFVNGVIGYINYDAIEDFYNIEVKKKSSIAKYEFKLAKLLIVINHTDQRLHIICNSFEVKEFDYSKEELIETDGPESYEMLMAKIEEVGAIIFAKEKDRNTNLSPIISDRAKLDQESKLEKPEAIKFESSSSKEKFIDCVDRAKEYINAGDIFQVVLSEKYTANVELDEFELYKNLKNINKSTYKSLINFNEITTICTSPETLVRKSDEYIETFPIAGTRAIKNDNRDNEREYELKNDEKELSEHLMLVDLGRNDISKVCKAGSVHVMEFCQIKKFSRVMHLVSRVEGKPKDSMELLDCVKATFPAGTVTGAPKLRAMQIIDELESSSRGLYAGSIVIIDDNANVDSCITIRTIQLKDNKVIIHAGAGIVKDSVGEHEYTEILNKSKAMFEAVEMTYEGEFIYDFIN